MKRLILLLALISLLSACKKKCDGCGPNQQCVDGVCQCKQWYEGANCDTPMIFKYDGIYIGSTYKNNSSPITDTFIFQSTLQPNVTNLIVSPVSLGYKEAAAISLTQTGAADYIQFLLLPNHTLEIQKKCGSATLSPDHKGLTLIYFALNAQGKIDSTTLYTFIGTRQ